MGVVANLLAQWVEPLSLMITSVPNKEINHKKTRNFDYRSNFQKKEKK
jgi:hypothetical protein